MRIYSGVIIGCAALGVQMILGAPMWLGIIVIVALIGLESGG